MTDDELLDRLSQALAPDRVEPPLAGVLALRRAIVAPPPRRLGWRPRQITAATAVFALVLSGSTAAFAVAGAPLPRPLRVVAHGVGLPVDSVAVADTRSAAARLKDALAQRNPATIDQAARQLRGRLAHLEPDEKGQIEQQTSVLLGEADQSGGQDNGPHHDQTSPTPLPSAPAGPSGGGSRTPGDQVSPGGQGTSDGGDRDAPATQTLPPVTVNPANPDRQPPTEQPTAPPGDIGGANQSGTPTDTGAG